MKSYEEFVEVFRNKFERCADTLEVAVNVIKEYISTSDYFNGKKAFDKKAFEDDINDILEKKDERFNFVISSCDENIAYIFHYYIVNYGTLFTIDSKYIDSESHILSNEGVKKVKKSLENVEKDITSFRSNYKAFIEKSEELYQKYKHIIGLLQQFYVERKKFINFLKTLPNDLNAEFDDFMDDEFELLEDNNF